MPYARAKRAVKPKPPPAEAPVLRRSQRKVKAEIAEIVEEEKPKPVKKRNVKDSDVEEDEYEPESEEDEDDFPEPESDEEDFAVGYVSKNPKRRKITVAKGEFPLNHSRVQVSDNSKRFKFRSSACQNSKTKDFNIQEYLVAVRTSRDAFHSNLAEEGCIPKLLASDEVTFDNSVPDSENLMKWLDRSSVKLAVRSDYTKKSKHTVAVKVPPPLKLKPETSLSIFTSKSFNLTLGKPNHEMNSYLVDAMMASPKLIANKKVYDVLTEISAAKNSRNQRIQAFFCGGPILAIKSAPLRASDGSEVVAITTVADEVTWEHEPGMASYIQFWKYNFSDKKKDAQLWFLLRVENAGSIVDMVWCPFFHEEVLKKCPKQKSKFDKNALGYLAVTTDVGKILIFKIKKEIKLPSDSPPIVISSPVFILKHPNVTIDNPNAPGKDSVHKYPKRQSGNNLTDDDEDAALDDQEISDIADIVSDALNKTNLNSTETEVQQNAVSEESTPKRGKRKRKPKSKKGVVQPTPEPEVVELVDENIQDEPGPSRRIDENSGIVDSGNAKKQTVEVDEAPFISLDWSTFSKCKDILAVSQTGWVLFYDLTKPDEAQDGIYDLSWESQPTSARWITKDTIAIGFQSRLIIYYDIKTKEKLFQDSTSRAVGTLVYTQPALFPGAFSYDTVRVVPEDRTGQYSVGVYQVVNTEESTGVVVPLPNKHQGQCYDLAACEMSGIIASVGCDGRLVESMNGRITCRSSEDDLACFVHRPVLQIIRHKHDGNHINEDLELSRVEAEKRRLETVDVIAEEPLIKHDKVNSSCWLEIRVGDATLIDQESHSKSSAYVEKITFDRRIESLTRLDFSKLSPGLAVTGGEAGIVFIVPTSL